MTGFNARALWASRAGPQPLVIPLHACLHCSCLALLTVLVFVLAPGNVAYASNHDMPRVIYACYEQASGELRVIDAREGCGRAERRLSWNAIGPPGPMGSLGSKGQKGDPGQTGKPQRASFVFNVGAVFFGVVVGWLTYRTVRRKARGASISDLAAVISAVGGGAVLALFKTNDSFGWYAIGLTLGFFGYLLVMLNHEGWEDTSAWMGDKETDDDQPGEANRAAGGTGDAVLGD